MNYMTKSNNMINYIINTGPNERPKRFIFIFIVFIIGIYTQFHLFNGNDSVIFPYAIAHGSIILFSYFIAKKNNWRIDVHSKKLYFWVIISANVFALNFIFTIHEGYDPIVPRIITLLQFIVSIYSAIILILLISQLNSKSICKALFVVLIIILTIASLERWSPLGPIIRDLNVIFYSWHPSPIYTAAGRDVAMWGSIRPLAFATEPSVAAIFSSLIICFIALLSGKSIVYKIVFCTSIGLISFIIFSSITTFFIIIGFILHLFLSRPGIYRIIGMFALMCFILAIIFLAILLFQMESRYVQNASFFGRLVAPILLLWDSIQINILFGFGFGPIERYESFINDIWYRTGMFARESYIYGASVSNLLTNSFWQHWVAWGVVGGFISWFIIHKIIKSVVGKYDISSWIWIAFTWQTIGGYVDLRSWGVAAMIIGLTVLSRNERKYLG